VTGRDDAPARPSHPTVDELADLREGLLTDADEARVRAHVADCIECTAETVALDDVAAMLREVGSQPITMPASVARAIDDAISDASAVRASAPAPDLGGARPTSRRHRAWVRPAFGWLAGAAAAAILIGGTGALLNGTGDTPTASDAGAAADSANAEGSGGGSGQFSPGTEPTPRKSAPKRLDELTIQSYARAFAAKADRPRAADGGTQGDLNGADGNELDRACAVHGIGGLHEPVVWKGDLAALVVRRPVRVAQIYTCDATPRLLYSAQY
jgi:hypothetical protein